MSVPTQWSISQKLSNARSSVRSSSLKPKSQHDSRSHREAAPLTNGRTSDDRQEALTPGAVLEHLQAAVSAGPDRARLAELAAAWLPLRGLSHQLAEVAH